MPPGQVRVNMHRWATVGMLVVLCILGIASAAMTPRTALAAASPEPGSVEAGAGDAVVLEVAYRFDAEGLVSLADASRLPVPRGSVTARWYALDGWVALVFEGLDLAAAGPLCLGTSTIEPASGLLTQASFAATAEGGCDDAGAGPVPLASGDTGVRICGDDVAYVTRIPVEGGGPLIANVVAFSGDGAGVGLTGRLESPRLDRELDAAIVACGALPPPRVPVPATPAPVPTPVITPAPHGIGSLSADQRAPAPAPKPQETCPDTSGGGLLDVNRTAAGPYLLHQPSSSDPDTATILFLPGGSGNFGAAQRAWQTFFSDGAGFEAFRVVIPYALDGDFIDQAMRTFDIVDEVLWCHDGDPQQVHLAGTSNGGLAAFGLMARQPERFATLLGAPGAFPVQDPASVEPGKWVELLAGRAVFNGVGEFDADWRTEVVATHNALAAAGIESVFAELPGQGHVPGTNFDSAPLLGFWETHP